MRRFILIVLFFLGFFTSCRKELSRPKIVVGIVVDQMRWDYLYRYYNSYGNGGFRKLIKSGYECRNTMINYVPTYTAPGHTCIYTGTVPAIHGIAGNDWVDKETGVYHYCVDDPNVIMTGDAVAGTSMSPANMLTTTVTDELRLATNFKSRVYGIALKDRSSILPAGHLANGAYWYNDKTGNFISSTYYKNSNPEWLQAFNKKKHAESMINEGWTLLNSISTYGQSLADSNGYEGTFKGERSPVFPHRFDSLSGPDRYAMIKSIPGGNTLSIMMAKACIEGENLGKGEATDFLALSLSTPDYVGHRFAPNSLEVEDTYLRLDKEIEELIRYLDGKFGRNGYLMFLTADHGGAHNPGFLTDNHVPAGAEPGTIAADINGFVKENFGIDSLVTFIENYQICLNEQLLRTSGKDREIVRLTIMEWLHKRPEVSFVLDMENMWRNTVPEPIRTMAINGYNPKRSGSIQVILNPAWYDNGGRTTGTTHGTWNPYDTHIPLLWYGWHIRHGATSERVNMTDIAPTIADLLNIQMPNGCTGTTIKDLVNKISN